MNETRSSGHSRDVIRNYFGIAEYNTCRQLKSRGGFSLVYRPQRIARTQGIADAIFAVSAGVLQTKRVEEWM